MATKKATEMKDNSIAVKGSIMNSIEHTVNKDQVVELKVRIPADELDGKRDAFAKVLKGTTLMSFTPNQTELDTGDDEEADGQTSLNVEEDGTKTPKQRAQDEKKAEA